LDGGGKHDADHDREQRDEPWVSAERQDLLAGHPVELIEGIRQIGIRDDRDQNCRNHG
jgi:hypothetical protein